MYNKLIKRLSFLHHLQTQPLPPDMTECGKIQDAVSAKIGNNENNLKNMLSKSSDIVFRDFMIGGKRKNKAFICFIDGLSDKDKLNEHVIKPLMVTVRPSRKEPKIVPEITLDTIQNSILGIAEIKKSTSLDEVIKAILGGDAVLFIDSFNTALLLGMKEWEKRSISEPQTESAIRGPREGFTETLRVNTAMVRRKIKNPNLVLESLTIGKQTRTGVCLGYIQGIANPEILKEVRYRLSRIDTDAILESGFLEQFIEDSPFSPFPTIGSTERPDIVAAKLLEGRIAVFCDGTPFVLTIPLLFMETLFSSEDYYVRPYWASFIRWLRFLSLFITVTTPALYVALETFHQELLPTVLLITAAAAREGIPFPAFLETVIIGIIFEILRESGIRMPRPVGQAVSIVGALVVGQAAVQAGIISAPMVIIAALTGITGFIVTPIIDAVVVFRFFLLILAATFGLYGIMIGIILILGHMCSLRSFGVPYLAPFAPTMKKELKDSLVRAPLWFMHSRPKSITWNNSERQAPSQMPSPEPPQEGDRH